MRGPSLPLVGCVDWTIPLDPFLFLQPKRLWKSEEVHVRPLVRLSVVWILLC